MEITFLLNGETQSIPNPSATHTLLDWLRDSRSKTGTKEGCNEGDCGACTVALTDANGRTSAVNACILLLAQVQGKSVTTVEGLSKSGGSGNNSLHPVQEQMIDHHGAQCGFCTPGIVMSLFAAHCEGQRDHTDVLAGNLCRCTGYAPILKAAQAAENLPPRLPAKPSPVSGDITLADGYLPETGDALAAWYLDNPDATLVSGATDVGLWITKDLVEPTPLAFLDRITDLKHIEDTDEGLRIGAGVTIASLLEAMEPRHASFAQMLRRFGSKQVRNSATIGGNIANGSPIGDAPPPLIALGASLRLRRGDERRDMALEDFFLDYGKQDRRPSEFVESVFIPHQPDTLHVAKISKRFDQDISAVCGAFNLVILNGSVTRARIAFGGMAAIPRRAQATEAALDGQAWSIDTIRRAQKALEQDFTPIDDMRASATYRMKVARNLLMRIWHQSHKDAPVSLTGERNQ